MHVNYDVYRIIIIIILYQKDVVERSSFSAVPRPCATYRYIDTKCVHAKSFIFMFFTVC